MSGKIQRIYSSSSDYLDYKTKKDPRIILEKFSAMKKEKTVII